MSLKILTINILKPKQPIFQLSTKPIIDCNKTTQFYCCRSSLNVQYFAALFIEALNSQGLTKLIDVLLIISH